MLTRPLLVVALLRPLAAAEEVVPQSGCTHVGLLAYACVQEEATSCGGFTAVGAGVTAGAGAAAAASQGCAQREIVATASVATVFVALNWAGGDAGCATVLFVAGAPVDVGCVAGAPPAGPWGEALP